MKYCLLLISFLFFSFFGRSQVGGIKSEEDLLRMGVPKSQIEQVKSQIAAQNGQARASSSAGAGEIKVIEKESQDSLKNVSITPKPTNVIKEDEVGFRHGHDLFIGSNFQVITNATSFEAPDDYRLGPGDKISIVIWGNSEMSAEYTLDKEGSIYPKLVGKVNLKGKTYGMAKNIVYSKFSRVYDLNSSEISINLVHSKVVSINLVGAVNNPGTYRLPSVNSVFGIVSYAGGVEEEANIREIKHIRNGQVIAVYDAYHFIHGNGEVPSTTLKDGDFIMVVSNPSFVHTKSGFKTEGYFEIREGETLNDLLKYAGGLNDNVAKTKVVITRVDGDGERIINIDFNDQMTFNTVELQSGDEVSFYTVTESIRNYVSIDGQVLYPGDYEYKEGENLPELISRGGGVTFSASDICMVYKMGTSLEYRVSSVSLSDTARLKEIIIEEFDRVQILSKADFIDKKSISVVGAVRKPGNIEYFDGITLKNAIDLSDGMRMEVFSEEIVVERLTFNRTSTNHYTKSLKVNYNEASNFLLKPFDIVVVRRLPEFSFHRQVKIYGEVKFPGEYTITNNSFKLLDLIEKAGGLTNYSDLDGASFERKKDSLGFVLMDLKEALNDSSSNYNYAIEEGDSIFIPRLVNLVKIRGAIGYKQVGSTSAVNVAYQKGKRARFYIKKYAAGFDKEARRYSIYTIRRDGLIQKSRFFGLIRPKVKNGDELVVLYKQDREERKKEKKPIDWNRQIENLTVKITGVLTVYAIARNIR